MTESEVAKRVVSLAAGIGIHLLRNNSGVAVNPAGQPVRFGLGNVSSKVNRKFKTPDYCGIDPDGFFIGVECKESGWTFRGTEREVAQANALNLLNRKGGLGVFCCCPALFLHTYQIYKAGKTYGLKFPKIITD